MAEQLKSALEKAKAKEVPPDLMTVLLIDMGETLLDISELQSKLLKHMEEVTPQGIDFPIPEQTVTDVTTINFLRDYPYRKIRSIDFFNKGPNTVNYRINEEAKEIPIEDREFMKAKRPKATIEYVMLRVASGESATIKMTGHI